MDPVEMTLRDMVFPPSHATVPQAPGPRGSYFIVGLKSMGLFSFHDPRPPFISVSPLLTTEAYFNDSFWGDDGEGGGWQSW